jgi:hypothetical protein
LRFRLKLLLGYAKNGSLQWFSRKTPNFFAEKWAKPPKIVIITLAPGLLAPTAKGNTKNAPNRKGKNDFETESEREEKKVVSSKARFATARKFLAPTLFQGQML